jgi:ribonuclease III
LADITQVLFSKGIKTNRKKTSIPASLGEIFRLFRKKSDQRKRIASAIRQITGFSPENIKIYQLALQHSSVSKAQEKGFRESNERLEYLGDAILGAVIAEYLFKKFPYKDEGFLTEIRSRIVNRDSLNDLCKKIGLNKLVEFDSRSYAMAPGQSIYGDALEAMVGAVFLDKGFKKCKKFIINRLLSPHFDISEVVSINSNYKSLLIEWSQRQGKKLSFSIIEEKGKRHQKEFTAQISVGENVLATGIGYSKKKAEQSAAQKACENLQLK